MSSKNWDSGNNEDVRETIRACMKLCEHHSTKKIEHQVKNKILPYLLKIYNEISDPKIKREVVLNIKANFKSPYYLIYFGLDDKEKTESESETEENIKLGNHEAIDRFLTGKTPTNPKGTESLRLNNSDMISVYFGYAGNNGFFSEPQTSLAECFLIDSESININIESELILLLYPYDQREVVKKKFENLKLIPRLLDEVSKLSKKFEKLLEKLGSSNPMEKQSGFNNIKKELHAIIHKVEIIKTNSSNEVLKKLEHEIRNISKKLDENEKNVREERVSKYLLKTFLSVIIIGAIAIFIYLQTQNNTPKYRWETNVISGEHNPNKVFSNDSTSFKLLVLPFVDNEKDVLSKLEKKFLRRFEKIILRDSLNIEVKYINDRTITPFHPNQVEKMVNEYRADLAIWGSFFENNNCVNDMVCVKYALSDEVLMKLQNIDPKINKSTRKTYFAKISPEIADGYLQEEIDLIIWWNISLSLFIKGEYQKIINLLTPILKSQPLNTEFNNKIAYAYYKVDDYSNATKYYLNTLMLYYGEQIPILGSNIKKFFSLKEKEIDVDTIPVIRTIINNVYNLNRYENNGITGLNILKKMVELLPREGLSWSLYIKALHEQKKGTEVSFYSLQCIKKNNQFDDSTHFLKIGDVLMKNGDRKLALLAYLCNNGSIRVQYAKSLFQEFSSHKSKAREVFNMVNSINLNNPRGWVFIAKILEENKDYKLAEEAIKNAIKVSNLGDKSSLVELGDFLNTRDKKLEAITAYENAIQIDSLKPDAWVKKATLLGSLDRCQEAIETCNRAINLFPKNGKLWFYKGLYHDRLGEKELALISFDKITEMEKNIDHSNLYDDGILDVRYIKGNLLIDLNRNKEALETFLEYKKYSKSLYLEKEIGRLYFVTKDFDNADLHLNDLLQNSEADFLFSEIYLYLGHIQLIKGNYDEAVKYYKLHVDIEKRGTLSIRSAISELKPLEDYNLDMGDYYFVKDELNEYLEKKD